MKIKTDKGIAEGVGLTDLQQYNRILKFGIVLGAVIASFIVTYLYWLTYYIIKHGVLNNYIASCGG